MLAYHQVITEQGGKARQRLLSAVPGEPGKPGAGWAFPAKERKKRKRSGVAMSAMDALCQIPGNSREGIQGVMDWMNDG